MSVALATVHDAGAATAIVMRPDVAAVDADKHETAFGSVPVPVGKPVTVYAAQRMLPAAVETYGDNELIWHPPARGHVHATEPTTMLAKFGPESKDGSVVVPQLKVAGVGVVVGVRVAVAVGVAVCVPVAVGVGVNPPQLPTVGCARLQAGSVQLPQRLLRPVLV
jgi:hypothetical protein